MAIVLVTRRMMRRTSIMPLLQRAQLRYAIHQPLVRIEPGPRAITQALELAAEVIVMEHFVQLRSDFRQQLAASNSAGGAWWSGSIVIISSICRRFHSGTRSGNLCTLQHHVPVDRGGRHLAPVVDLLSPSRSSGRRRDGILPGQRLDIVVEVDQNGSSESRLDEAVRMAVELIAQGLL